MGRMVNKEQTQSKPNEGLQLHHPELLIAAAQGDSDEIKRLLLVPPHREEDDAARQPAEVVLDVDEETIAVADVKKPAPATAVSPSEAVTGAGDSVLHVVASSGDGDEFLKCAKLIVDMADHLLSAPNGKRDTPLHCAARFGNTRMVSHLLDMARARNSDVGVKAILGVQNDKEETVLHEAVRLEDKDLIDELLSADSQLACVPLTDDTSPLYLALSRGHTDIALQLLQKDKELSYSGPDGQNALHAAIQWRGGQGVIEMLLYRNKDLIKQADQSSGRTPLHYAALLGETSVTELLLGVDPSPAYLPDSNGSFPIHLAASCGGHYNVLALLQGSGPYCAQLRDGKGRTFLHVAVQKKSWAVVKYACQEQGKMLASSVMNMQDDDGNTALHLAVEDGIVYIVRALVSIPKVKLNITNKKGETPLEVAFIRYIQQGIRSRYSNTEDRICGLLLDAPDLTISPRENILQREMHKQEERLQSINDRTQIIGLGSVLITTVTFAAAFAVPGGYQGDGTPTLAGQYAFDAFVMANTLAFTLSGLSIIYLMVAGLGTESRRRKFSLLNSVNFLAYSAKSLGATFAFGMYAVLAPVERKKAIASCFVTVGALVAVEVGWTFRAVTMVYSDKVVLVKRFGISRWRLARAVLWTLMFELAPYIIISLSGLK